jgi:hypothetical protein
MAFGHGKETIFTVDGEDLSEFTNTSELTREADVHDVTTYTKDDYVYRGGLRKSNFSAGGIYESAATGPRAILEPLVGTNVTLIRKPEGTGTGKPQQSVEVVVGKYVETAPVADFIKWSCEFTGSGPITDTTQA